MFVSIAVIDLPKAGAPDLAASAISRAALTRMIAGGFLANTAATARSTAAPNSTMKSPWSGVSRARSRSGVGTRMYVCKSAISTLRFCSPVRGRSSPVSGSE